MEESDLMEVTCHNTECQFNHSNMCDRHSIELLPSGEINSGLVRCSSFQCLEDPTRPESTLWDMRENKLMMIDQGFECYETGPSVMLLDDVRDIGFVVFGFDIDLVPVDKPYHFLITDFNHDEFEISEEQVSTFEELMTGAGFIRDMSLLNINGMG